MRLVTTVISVLSLSVLLTVPALAEELQSAKVYRDYPGYINPAVCENPVSPTAQVDGQCGVADQVAGPYMSAWAGIVATQDADADPDIDVAFDNGYGVGMAVGYDFGPVRLEVEASHRESNIDEVTVNGGKADRHGDLEIQALLINGFADLKTGGNMTPYLGAGIGFAKIDLGNDDDTVLAGQLAAGVLIAVSPTVAIDIGYRFMMTDDPKINGTEYEVRQHTAMLGVQIRF